MQKPNIPTIFIIFGATGDLMARKIVPSLFHLFVKNRLPKLFTIIGVARRSFTDEDFKKHVLHILKSQDYLNLDKIDQFLKYFSYQKGQFEDEKDYITLAQKLGRIDGEWKTCSNKLFYLAVPPIQYKTIFQHLASSGLTLPCSPTEGWTRVLVEKPFGKDLETAESLDLLLGKLFKEEQIYRIDHYLAKDMLQNILAFRFSNNLLEGIWNNRHIEKIEVKILEKDGIDGRGEFYDGIGALRDIGQNHILQMLALVAMDSPNGFDVLQVRQERTRILKTLEKFTTSSIKEQTFRAQYAGYQKVEGVKSNSQTETYFKIKTFLENSRWQGVPIFLEGGKALSENRKEIAVFFKHPTPCLCPKGEKHRTNKIIFSIEPKEEIAIRFWSKEPGLAMNITESMFHFDYKDKKSNNTADEYEKLLLDCIEGNQLLFISTPEIKAMWQFIDPIVSAWSENKILLSYYIPNKNEIRTEAFFDKEIERKTLKKEIGIIGLGKMGANTARLLIEKRWRVVGFNRSSEDTKRLEKEGLEGAYSLEEFASKLPTPRIVYLMLPAGEIIDEVLFGENGLHKLLSGGDIVVDAGNSFYKDTIERYEKLVVQGLRFTDVGTSGGPSGARTGASLMVGGKKEVFDYLLPLFLDLSTLEGVQFFEGIGAGHFVKMIHNGIEYGMMQSIAEGFNVLKESEYKLDLEKVAEIYNHGSVIESRLIGWLKDAFELHGENLKDVSGSVSHTGEGKWMVETAKELGLKAKIIEEALKFRVESEKDPSFVGKILSSLREQFGGHKV